MPPMHRMYKYDKPSGVTSEEAKALLRYVMGIPTNTSLDAFLVIGITTTPESNLECISMSNWDKHEEELIVNLYVESSKNGTQPS